MKKIIILITFVLSTFDALSQSTVIKKEIIDNDTVMWIKDHNKKGDLGEYLYVYITSDEIKLPPVQGDQESSLAYITKTKPIRDRFCFYEIASEFTLEEIRVLLQSKDNIPMLIFFFLDTRGEVTNMKFRIHPDIASKFSSREISRIRNAIKSKFKFKNDPNYKPYNYMSFTWAARKKFINSILDQLIKSQNKEKKSNELKESR